MGASLGSGGDNKAYNSGGGCLIATIGMIAAAVAAVMAVVVLG